MCLRSSTEPGGARREKGYSCLPMMSNSKLKSSLLHNLKFNIPNNLREVVYICIYGIIYE